MVTWVTDVCVCHVFVAENSYLSSCLVLKKKYQLV